MEERERESGRTLQRVQAFRGPSEQVRNVAAVGVRARDEAMLSRTSNSVELVAQA